MVKKKLPFLFLWRCWAISSSSSSSTTLSVYCLFILISLFFWLRENSSRCLHAKHLAGTKPRDEKTSSLSVGVLGGVSSDLLLFLLLPSSDSILKLISDVLSIVPFVYYSSKCYTERKLRNEALITLLYNCLSCGYKYICSIIHTNE